MDKPNEVIAQVRPATRVLDPSEYHNMTEHEDMVATVLHFAAFALAVVIGYGVFEWNCWLQLGTASGALAFIVFLAAWLSLAAISQVWYTNKLRRKYDVEYICSR